MDATYVGIDVSKDRLDVHVQPTGEAFAVARDGEGLAALIERLKPLSPHLVAVEATGGFEMTVAAAVAGAALPLAVVNPAQVRHYAQALGRHAKTDRIDAEVIARFAAATRPEPRALPDEATQALAALQSGSSNAAGFDAWLDTELARRRDERKAAALKSLVDRRLPKLTLTTVDGRPYDMAALRDGKGP